MNQFGKSHKLRVVSSGEHELHNPLSLAWHPITPQQLWVSNSDTESVTVLSFGDDAQAGSYTAQQLRDRAPYHYMAGVTSLSFVAKGRFATCQESINTYSDTHTPNFFMGPTLYDSKPSMLVTSSGDACAPGDTCFMTHIDMLHEAPYCMGITHDPSANTPEGNVYWAFDGGNGHLVRFDFEEDHGPGSMDHTLASVRRYSTLNLTRVAGVPGHMLVDGPQKKLYIADTGGNRVLVVKTDSGNWDRDARAEYPIFSSPEPSFNYSIWSNLEWEVLAAVQTPSSLSLVGDVLHVAEYGSGHIVSVNTVSGHVLQRTATGAKGLTALAVEPQSGSMWYADGLRNELVEVQAPAVCCPAPLPHQSVAPQPASASGQRP